jgi:hypothetical protein
MPISRIARPADRLTRRPARTFGAAQKSMSIMAPSFETGKAQAITPPRRQIEVTALHNHILNDAPRLFFMHFWANDDARKLARDLKAALAKVQVGQP